MVTLIKQTVLATALLASIGSVGVFAATGAQAGERANDNPSFERFKDRIAAIEEKYPEAAKAVVPELGKNVPMPSAAESGSRVEKEGKNPNDPNDPDDSIPKIEKVVNLGITSMRAVSAKDGTLLFISDAGRFVFMGRMLDVWQQKELKTIDEIERATQRVFLDSMGYDKTSYAGYKLGSGPRRTVVFVDPHCGWCHQFIAEVKADEELMKAYTFIFHVIPILGSSSQPYAKKLWCSVGTDEEKMQALLDGDEAVNGLPASAECPMGDQDRAVLLSKIIGVQGVPFVIAPDGRVSQGKPSDIKAFLHGEERKSAPGKGAAEKKKAAP